MLKSMNRKNSQMWIFVQSMIALLLLFGCGGGANDTRVVTHLAVSLSDSNGYVEVEMIKSVEGTTSLFTLEVEQLLSGVEASSTTVVLDDYELSYQRIDGGNPNLDTQGGPLAGTLTVSGTIGEVLEVEIPVVTTFQKVYSAFGQSFRNNPSPVEFRANIRVRAHTLAGETITAVGGFTIECGVFNPIDELLPIITHFDYSSSVPLGNDWVAGWSTAGVVSSGNLLTPFGDSVALEGFLFPVGSFRQNTAFLAPQFGESVQDLTYPGAVLTVSNLFGSAVNTSGPSVTVQNLDAPSTNSVSVTEFFANRYSLVAGDSTTLTWVVEEGPTSISILPSEYSGVTLDLGSKDPSFDSITIIPDSTVRPIMLAEKSSNRTQDSRFLDQPITVSGGGGPSPPEIVFFSVSHSSVSLFQQVAFFWKVSGDFEKLELLPINGQSRDVTGRESFLSPPLTRLGTNAFSLIATGVGGSPIVTSTLNVSVTAEVVNQPPTIQILDLAPGSSIDNGDSGAFSFRIDDPENKDSSWTVFRVAGDGAVYGPSFGLIPGGHGDATVTFTDAQSSNNGFITFEISAYDDDDYGYSGDGNRTVELVTFTTTGRRTDNAPTIATVSFTPGNLGTGLLPGQDGVLSFSIFDPDTDDLRWEVQIIAGDFGGTLNGAENYTQGSVGTGSGDIDVHYQDDPDSTDDAVVFLIKVTELLVVEPQSSSVVFRVDYLSDDDGSIAFNHNGLYNNGLGIVDPTQRLAFYLNYSGIVTSVAGAFTVDHDGLIPAPALSIVLDIQHGSEDPGRIADVTFDRTFIVPLSDNENFGEFNFGGYFDFPGEDTSAGANPSPTTDGVSRWFSVFGVESFRADTGGTYNLPIIDGTVRNYFVNVSAFDEDNTQENIQLLLTVESVNP